jgi:hypothetical protein
VRERSSHVQRIQKTLEDANIKLDSVIAVPILGTCRTFKSLRRLF